ncbi:salicylate 1-monooxygenase [Rhodocollybia butyracea]|uniref:Salicylate 1-monooxygenase n=1 Tax=Rhodocollybia butyracea TaxID=206335 RepID=A0A9P5U980_9AGAR|nr:salicylate 1-monooxygenase [Rhodocollybia butyracea]
MRVAIWYVVRSLLVTRTRASFAFIDSGGGIGGMLHACALGKYPDISVNVYESSTKFSPFGAGIGVWPRAWNILCSLGLGEDMAKLTSVSPTNDPAHSFSFRKSDQLNGFTFGNLFSRGPLLTFHRAQFQQVLAQHLAPSCRIQYSKRLKSYTQNRHGGPIYLSFEDGTQATCDVLVGADGIKSVVRKCLLRDRAETVTNSGDRDLPSCTDYVSWIGSVAYRALIPVARLKEDCDKGLLSLPTTPTMYVGTNVHVVVYPVNKGQTLNLAVFHLRPELQGVPYCEAWSKEVEIEELLNITRFESWETEVNLLLKHVHKPTRWAIHKVRNLPTFISDKGVALLGDAAHAASPHQGSGAGQAIEDAYFLAKLLGDPRTTLETLPRALRVYDNIRRPWTQETSAKANANALYFTLHYDGFDFVNADAAAATAKLHELTDLITDNWKWCWTTTVDSSLKEALSQLG